MRDRAEHLADQHSGWGILCEEIRSRGRDRHHAKLAQVVVAGELDRQIPREPVRALNNNRPHAITRDTFQSSGLIAATS